MSVGHTGDSRVVHQSQSSGSEAGVGLKDNAVLVTEISDRPGSQQWMALILKDSGWGQALLLTKLQELHQLALTEVTNAQTANLLAYKLAHFPVGLQSHLGRPVERNHLQMKNICSGE